MKRRIVATSVAALTVAAGGAAAVAATGGSQQEDSKAVIDDVAKDLGVQPSELSDALKKALANRVDAAVAAGQITKAEGDALKERIASQEYPLLGAASATTAARAVTGSTTWRPRPAYLGLSEAELRTQLSGDKTLADVARLAARPSRGSWPRSSPTRRRSSRRRSRPAGSRRRRPTRSRERPGAVH